MRVSRVYLPQALASGKTIQLQDESAHYILTVLRLKPGYSLVVFNGDGGEYQATITHLGPKKSLTLSIDEYQPKNLESPLQTTLALGITRGERMDYAIQKAVELGVTKIVPLFTEYAVVKLNSQQAERRHRHWSRIAEHACEQCGRTVLPQIDLPLRFSEWLQQPRQGYQFLFDPAYSRKLAEIQTHEQQIYILIGPEGGFSEVEINFAANAGFESMSLGPRVLRSETAVVAALTTLQHHWGDM